MKIVYVLENI